MQLEKSPELGAEQRLGLGPDVYATDGYVRSMPTVASRELRNDTAGVLRRVQAGRTSRSR